MKFIYEFTIPKKEIKPETTDSKDVEGNPIKITKDVEQEVPYFFAVKRPSRDQLNRAELFYAASVNQGYENGLMSYALLAKRFDNDGGIYSEQDKEDWAAIKAELKDVLTQLAAFEKKTIDEKTEDDKVKIKELETKRFQLLKDHESFKSREEGLYDNTAEFRAKTKTSIWWQLELLFKKVGEEYLPIFPKADIKDVLKEFEHKHKLYDELLESVEDNENDSRFWKEALLKNGQIVTLWQYTGQTKAVEIDKLIQQIERPELSQGPTGTSSEAPQA